MDQMEIEGEVMDAASKKSFTIEQWECDLKAVKIPKEDMNWLVMNYLVTEGNLDAAKKFQKESGTKLEVKADLASITIVCEAVKSGNVDEAIEKLNGLNPEILKTNPELFFHLQLQKMIELIRDKKLEEALACATNELRPYAEQNAAFTIEFAETVRVGLGDPLTSQYNELFDKSQRVKRADEVTAAFLRGQGAEKDSKLQNMVRMLNWTQNQLDEKADYPRISDFSTCQLEDPAK